MRSGARCPLRHARRAIRACALGLAMLLAPPVHAQTQLELRLPAQVSDPRTPQVMRDLAERIIPIYHDPDRRAYLTRLSALQEVAGSWEAAYAAQLSLAELDHRTPSDIARTPLGVYELHARARALESQERAPYADALARSFDALARPLDDLSAYRLAHRLRAPYAPMAQALQGAFDQHRGQTRISLNEALDLIQDWAALDAQRSIAPLAGRLIAADEERRYIIEEPVRIPLTGGGVLEGVVVRPRGATGRLPALLTLSLDDERREAATEHAAHGYPGVVVGVHPVRPAGRGRRRPVEPAPFEHEGEDARAVIRWITGQGFSNGRVAMVGEGYSAFAAWAAARHPPEGLSALVVAGATAPGIDLPMEGGIFRTQAYRWLLHATGQAGDEVYRDEGRWRALDERWFESGRPFRDLDRLYGVPSPVFQRWLTHPLLDAYWRARLPTRAELAALSIPVLTLTGYYDEGEAGALYYFTQHRQARPRADHTLLIGPYDHEMLRGSQTDQLAGYWLDAGARIDLTELRYQWLDHVLRGAPRPGLLAAPINYEVMGANTWRHVPELPAGSTLRLYLDPAAPPQGAPHRLVRERPPGRVAAELAVDFREATAPTIPLNPPILAHSLLWRDALRFISDPIPDSIELTGHPQLSLLQSVSMRDVDLTVTLYELLPDGQYLLLYAPPYEQRASLARDPAARRLLTPRYVAPLNLGASRFVARRTQPGSRLVLLLGVKRRPDEEVNYGTGGDVSRETRAGVRQPLTVRWYSGSYLEIPAGP